MVTITSSGNSVQFTFQNCPTYLNNGTIEVPKDSLALVVDDSDMVTFKKADSNDIFLSITLDELGMTKNEIISFYQSDMTGGDGVTPEEVEEMIDEAISGKADTSTVETLSGEVQTISGQVATKADTTALTAYFDDAKYEMSGQTHVINFYNGQTVKATINADDFIKDGMVDTVVVSGNNLVITFNTDSGKQPIIIPLSDIFDPTNYYTTGQTDSLIAAATSGKADTTALTAHTSDTTIHVTASDKAAWNGKQDALVSGTNIKTVNNQSLLGSGNIEIQGGMTPAQEETIATALNELYDGIDEVSGNVGTLSGQVQTISSQTEGKADTTALTAHTSDATIHVTASDKTAWNGKLDADALAPYWTSAQTDTAITQATSGKANASAVEALSDEIDAKEEVISTAINELYDGLADVADDVTTVSGNVSTLTTTVTGIQTDLGGIKLVKLTRAQYEALVTKDSNTLYIIPDE